jgi:Protein of unknown function (DUF1565)
MSEVRLKKFFLSLLLATCGGISSAQAADYFVSTSGSDGNSGSSGSPWRSLQKAMSSVPANQGHTINVGAGTWDVGSLSPIAGTHLKGAGRSATTIQAEVTIRNSPNVEISNLSFEGKGTSIGQGIYVLNSPNPKLHDINVSNYGGICLSYEKSDGGKIYNAAFSNCTNGGGGSLNFADSRNVEIHDFTVDTRARGGAAIGIYKKGWDVKNPTRDRVFMQNFKIYNCDLKVNAWHNWTVPGSGARVPMTTIEFYWAEYDDIEIFNCNFNNNISLVSNVGKSKIRLHHNKFEGGGNPMYCLEANVDNMEFDHNHCIGGTYPLASFDAGATRNNLSVHHNVFENNSTPTLMLHLDGVRNNVKAFNNTLFTNNSSINLIYFNRGPGAGYEVRNNIFAARSGAAPSQGMSNNLFSGFGVIGNGFSGNPQFAGSGVGVYERFTPNNRALVVDKGQIIPGITDGFVGAAPDLGAIEVGGTPWRTGPGATGGTPAPKPTSTPQPTSTPVPQATATPIATSIAAPTATRTPIPATEQCDFSNINDDFLEKATIRELFTVIIRIIDCLKAELSNTESRRMKVTALRVIRNLKTRPKVSSSRALYRKLRVYQSVVTRRRLK